MTSARFVTSTTEPAFAVDPRGCIRAWNSAAEELFGYPASEVIDRRCWKLLAGRDLYGNDYCTKGCPLRQMAQQGRPLHPCCMVFYDGAGQPVEARVSLLVAPRGNPSELLLVHLLYPGETGGSEPDVRRGCPGSRNARLSDRELEVLRWLSAGLGTEEIARALGLSANTVRNHIQHVLDKLRVHTRLEAVALARRLGLVS